MLKNIVRTRKCTICAGEFTYAIGRGTDRKHCSNACVKRNARARSKGVKKRCDAEGCTGLARCEGAAYCEAHYYRMRRTGTLDRKKKITNMTPDGYVLEWDMTHPLSTKTVGGVMQHRRVLFDAIGEGPHACYWCENTLQNWDDVKVDHVNGIKHDNAIANLVPSCNTCNRVKGSIEGLLKRIGIEKMNEVFSAIVKTRSEAALPLPDCSERTRTVRVARRHPRHFRTVSVLESEDW